MAPAESIEKDLAVLDQQEDVLQFAAFDANTAWNLGSRLRDKLLERKAGGSVEIEVAGHLLFACTTPGATPGQANWIRRKRNSVRHFGRSTYVIGRKLERDGTTLPNRHGLRDEDHVVHGGGFPLVLRGTGMVGSVVLSGLPQRDDHNLVVEALSEVLGVDVPRLA